MEPRCQDTGKEDRQGQGPHALPVQRPDPGKQGSLGSLTLELKRHKRKAVGDHEEDDPGTGQGQGAIQTVWNIAMNANQRKSAAS